MATIVKKCEHTPAQRRSCKDNWIVRYRDSAGRQREKSYLWNQKEIAKTFGLEVEAAKKKGETVDPKARAVKFRDAAERFLKAKSESTKKTYRHLLDNHVLPAVGGMSISAVASMQGRDVIETLLKDTLPAEPNPLGPTSVLAVYNLIKSVINAEIRRGVLNRHHLAAIELDAKPVRAEFVFPSHAQLSALAALLPAEYRLTIWLMRGCGLRIGEALAVKVTDFIAPGVLRVREQQLPNKVYGPLKHRKADDYRDVPVPSYVAKLVAAQPRQEDGRLFPPVWHATFNRWFDRARDASGIDGGFTRHSLRHLFASVSLANGVPITDVGHWLGHKDINTTYSIYGHLVPSSWDRARNVLDVEYDTWRDSGEAQAA